MKDFIYLVFKAREVSLKDYNKMMEYFGILCMKTAGVTMLFLLAYTIAAFSYFKSDLVASATVGASLILLIVVLVLVLGSIYMKIINKSVRRE